MFHYVFSMSHGLLLSYFHGKRCRKEEEIDVGMNNECFCVNNENIVSSVDVFL